MNKKFGLLVSVMLLVGLVGTACGGEAAIAEAPLVTEEAAAPAVPAEIAEEAPVMAAAEEEYFQPVGVIDSQISSVDGALMVYVPEGNFLRGSTDEEVDITYQKCVEVIGEDCKRYWFEAEQPQREIYLDAFWIDQTEVTNAQYGLCVDDGECDKPSSSESWTRASYYGDPAYDDYPVIEVSWEDANAYCRWAGRRLPTEAEWEKAARGTNGRTYPWGENINCDLANYGSCVGDTLEVGSYPDGASPYGALDMAGNVWEWVADWYDADYYRAAPERNPPGPSSGEYRVLRGGSWRNIEWYVRSADRFRSIPSSGDYYGGFRCAASP